MTERAPRVTAQEVLKALERGGFTKVRQSGSHQIFRNAEGNCVTVLFHARETPPSQTVQKYPQHRGLDRPPI